MPSTPDMYRDGGRAILPFKPMSSYGINKPPKTDMAMEEQRHDRGRSVNGKEVRHRSGPAPSVSP